MHFPRLQPYGLEYHAPLDSTTGSTARKQDLHPSCSVPLPRKKRCSRKCGHHFKRSSSHRIALMVRLLGGYHWGCDQSFWDGEGSRLELWNMLGGSGGAQRVLAPRELLGKGACCCPHSLRSTPTRDTLPALSSGFIRKHSIVPQHDDSEEGGRPHNAPPLPICRQLLVKSSGLRLLSAK